eukprot:6211040-Pleurochrysis_carterae.AAC.2
MEPAERDAFLAENKITAQMGKIVTEGYHALHLHHFYTAGADEVKCWTIRDGWTAPKAAGTIHTVRELPPKPANHAHTPN